MTEQADDALLKKLGYNPALKRTLGLLENFGIAFCYISPVVGVYSLFGYGLATAGPAFVWSIPIVALGQLFVALVFAEVGSAYPLAGALYQWGKLLVGQRYGWLVGWIYGWALLVTIAAVDYAGAPYVAQMLGKEPTARTTLIITLILLATHTTFNLIGVKASAAITKIGVVGEVAATVIIAGVLIAAGLPQSPSVLLEGNAETTTEYAPLFFAAMLSPVWVFYGFESAGDVAEEVVEPSKKVPRAILLSLIGAIFVTAFLMVTLVLAAPNIPEAARDPAKTIAIIFEARLGSTIKLITLILIVFAYFSCATAIQAACARLVFAYARDDKIPGSAWLKVVAKESKAPQNALFFTGIVALVVVVLSQVDVGAVNVNALIVSYASIGIYASFQLVVLGYLIARSRGWRGEGDFKLGRYATPIAILAQIYGLTMLVNLAWPRPASELAGWFPLISAALIVGSGGVWLALSRAPKTVNT